MEKASETGISRHDPSETVLCSVCVGTYQRPDLLEKLLRSLRNQLLPSYLKVEVIVVDNDAKQSGAPVMAKFENTQQMCFFYYVQPVKNISLTRNMAVAHASGQYLLFIDDDEAASPEWISFLLNTMIKYDADAVFGPVLPEFNDETPRWLRHQEFYLPPIAKTGKPPRLTNTGNCIVKSALLKTMEAPFCPSYGVTGGEDTHLFDRLKQQGARFVTCEEARVTEYLPPSRTRISYLFLRALRGGNAHTRRCIEFAGKKRISVRIWMVYKATFLGMVSAFMIVFSFPSSFFRTQWLLKLSSNLGRFLAVFGWYYKGYL